MHDCFSCPMYKSSSSFLYVFNSACQYHIMHIIIQPAYIMRMDTAISMSICLSVCKEIISGADLKNYTTTKLQIWYEPSTYGLVVPFGGFQILRTQNFLNFGTLFCFRSRTKTLYN